MILFDKLFAPIANANAWEFCLIIACGILLANICMMISKLSARGAHRLVTWIKSKIKTAKAKCAAIQCPFCGKTLDRCVCAKNKNRSYGKRYRVYKKWKKANAKKAKAKNKE
jgi:hypothetical protein